MSPSWFCIRSQPKHEHIAAAKLREIQGVEVFNPRLRSRKATRRGVVWVTESLFPNYLFARFVLQTDLDQVRYASGVNTVVHFAHRWPTVPDEVIEDLRLNFDTAQLKVMDDNLAPGDGVTIAEGTLAGAPAIVLRVMPAKQRVQVLLDILGRSTTVELSLNSVVRDTDSRALLIAG